LLELQNKFIDGVYNFNEEIFAEIKQKKIAKSRLLRVYQNNLYEVLINALKITFKDVFNFLGEKKFREIAKKFIAKNRSQSGNLDDYGFEFIDFLQDDFLHDLALINWNEQKSYLGKNDPKLNLIALQNLEEEKFANLKFKLSNNCYFVTSKFSLFARSKRNLKRKKTCFYLIHRPFFDAITLKITKKEFIFLQAIKENLTLTEINDKYACDVAKNMQKFIENRVLVEFYF
jgi:hypothetical protein